MLQGRVGLFNIKISSVLLVISDKIDTHVRNSLIVQDLKLKKQTVNLSVTTMPYCNNYNVNMRKRQFQNDAR